MINGKMIVPIDEGYNVNVNFHALSQKVEIVISLTSENSLKTADFLFARGFNEIVIVNELGQVFTAYDCIFVKRITKADKIIIFGQYKTLIRGRNIPNAGEIFFHFEGLDDFFGKSSDFPCFEVSSKENRWGLLNNNGTAEAVAKISGIDGIDSLIALLVKVREYFEFLIDREISIDRIVYSDSAGTSIEIINDKFLMSKNDCLFNQTIQEKPETVIKDINQWLLHYEAYKEVIHIWRKTIYNRQVSDEDVFIWRCQSLELLCTLYKPLFDEAKQRIKEPKKQPFPNLSNFLGALNTKQKFIVCDNAYFDEVRKVRDVYTHYNPKKHISKREWWNASHLIQIALKAALGYVMGLKMDNIDFFILMPPGTDEEIRR